MIEKLLLPQNPRGLSLVGPARFEFETLQEMEQVARRSESLREKVKMVWHDAIGRDGKISRSGFTAENIQQPQATLRVLKNLPAIETAHRYEIELLAGVVRWAEADVLMPNHPGKNNTRIGVVGAAF